MKTSQEMREFAKKYECPSKQVWSEYVSKREQCDFESIEKSLLSMDDVVFSFSCAVMEYPPGDDSGFHGFVAVALTNKKLIITGKTWQYGFWKRTLSSPRQYEFRFDEITSVQLIRDEYVRLTIVGEKDISFGQFTSDVATELYNKIREIISNQNNDTTPETGNVSIPSQIKEYKELLDLGIITQEEFDAKKKELLGL